MQSEFLHDSARDSQSVSAVRGGDVERYRELVQRHERRVFAVAWSRLGDAGLAEEATQEAFIRGYRRLWLLGDGAKFSGWITSIARHAAINLGLRQRRELNKRHRWALEQTDVPETSAEEASEACTPETLRQTLAQLPDAHRECLVVFYLEGKSGAEAAAALGISETAFRVRLHRARGALREQLEVKLESSLQELRPAKSLVPLIMAGVLASSSAKAGMAGGSAAVGAKVLSVVGKTFLFSWIAPLILFVGMLPSLAFVRLFERLERANFRDKDGFRPRLLRKNFRSFIWGYPLMVILMFAISYFTVAAWGLKGSQRFLVIFMLVLVPISARSLTICRNGYQLGMFAYVIILAVGTSAFVFRLFPARLSQLPMVLGSLLFILLIKRRPARMDYSLFLRAAHGLLYAEVAEDPPQTSRLDRRALLRFARFLGARFLVSNFRWEKAGLRLRLPSVKRSFLAAMASIWMPPISQRCSHILLRWDGTVIAQCGGRDATDLVTVTLDNSADPNELQSAVAKAVTQAWSAFRVGKFTMAERVLGELPESQVFIVSPARAKSTRSMQLFMGAAVLLMIIGMLVQIWAASLSGLKPVKVSQAQIRGFLGGIVTNPNPILHNTRHSYIGDPISALSFCLVFPETRLFTSNSLWAARQEVFRAGGLDPQRDASSKLSAFRGGWLLHKAMVVGWFDWNDVGLNRDEAAAHFQHIKTTEWLFELSHRVSSSSDVKAIDDFTLNQLRWLRSLNCLDLTNRENVIQQIVSAQVLSRTTPGKPPISDWQEARGLFFTPPSVAMQDTYFSVAALEILGGLDKIDREACINGILSRHRGKGYFSSPDSGGFNEYHIDGSARDTIAAFESLRILGALSRVKDLDKWQFRVASYRSSKPASNGVRTLTWDEVEAWVCQQRLTKILRELKENPTAPVRSLLES